MRLHLAEMPVEQIVSADTGRRPSAALEESMRRYGMLEPLDVRGHGDGAYELVGGSRRLLAARRLGWATVPAVVEPAEAAALPVEMKALLLNLHRENLQQIHLARQARAALARLGCSQADLAGQLKMGRSTLSQMLSVLGCADLVAAIEDEGLEFGAAKRMTVLLPRVRATLLQELRESDARDGRFPSVRCVEARVREYQGHHPLPRVELTQLVEVGLALDAQGIAVEIESVPSKQAGMRVTLRLDDDTAAALRTLLEEGGRSRVGTTAEREERAGSRVGTTAARQAGAGESRAAGAAACEPRVQPVG